VTGKTNIKDRHVNGRKRSKKINAKPRCRWKSEKREVKRKRETTDKVGYSVEGETREARIRGTEITREREMEELCMHRNGFRCKCVERKGNCGLQLQITFSLSLSLPLFLSQITPFLFLIQSRIFRDAVDTLITLINFSFCFVQERDNTMTYVFHRHLQNLLY